jgi:DNA-binding transcriptional MocR family regulator
VPAVAGAGELAGEAVARVHAECGDAAGMHLVVRFDVQGILNRARRNGVRLLGTGPYYSVEPVEDECILRFSGLSARALVEAVRRLAS